MHITFNFLTFTSSACPLTALSLNNGIYLFRKHAIAISCMRCIYRRNYKNAATAEYLHLSEFYSYPLHFYNTWLEVFFFEIQFFLQQFFTIFFSYLCFYVLHNSYLYIVFMSLFYVYVDEFKMHPGDVIYVKMVRYCETQKVRLTFDFSTSTWFLSP